MKDFPWIRRCIALALGGLILSAGTAAREGNPSETMGNELSRRNSVHTGQGRGVTEAGPSEGDTAVKQPTTIFDPFLESLAATLDGVADVGGMTHRLVGSENEHLIVFVEGAEETPATMVAMADNYRMSLEYQRTSLDDGTSFYGFILAPPSPTIEMCWELHPYEAVTSIDGAWEHPVADLADALRLVPAGNKLNLELSEGARARIDRLSALQGHRAFRLRYRAGSVVRDLGSFSWLPGMRQWPGLDEMIPDDAGVPLAALFEGQTSRAEARRTVAFELGLPSDVSWTVAEAAPHTVEPLYVWAVHRAIDGGASMALPWFYADGASPRQWISLASPTAEGVAAPLPRHWTLSREGGGQLLCPPAAGGRGADEERVIEDLFRRYLGRDMALVAQGKVIALFPVHAARPEGLAVTQWAGGGMEHLASVLRAAGQGDESNGLRVADETPDSEPLVEDLFQVRLMAEPQDRKLIPVTHFRAPGSPSNVRVAVQNDVILDSRAVLGASIEQKGDAVYLHLELTPEGRAALDGVCFSNLGKQLAIVFDGRLLSAPTIDEWEHFELAFKGLDADWPDVARGLLSYLGQHPPEKPEAAL